MDVNALRVLNFGDQVLLLFFVATSMMSSFKMLCLILSVTHFLTPPLTLLTGDAVASSKSSISMDRYARGHLQNG